MKTTHLNIIGWSLLVVGWLFHFADRPVFGLPFFGAALAVFVMVLYWNFFKR